MEVDNFSVRCLVKEIEEVIKESYVNKVSEIEQGVIKIKLHTKQGSKDLILSKNVFYLTSFSYQARHGKSAFVESLKKNLYNKRIVGIEQHGTDRVVKILFRENTLVIELIGKGNKVLLDKEGKVVSCERQEEWADRRTKRGEKYYFPSMKMISPLELKEEELAKVLAESQKDLIRTLIGNVNISPVFAEELLFRLKLNKAKKASEVTRKEVIEITRKIKTLFEAHKEELTPCLYDGFAYPIELTGLKQEEKKMDSFNSCIDTILSKQAPVQKIEKKQKAPKLEFLRKQQEEARAKFLKAIEENTKKGEAIYANLNEIEEMRLEVLRLAKSGMNEEEIMKRIIERSENRPFFKSLRKVLLKEKKIEIEV